MLPADATVCKEPELVPLVAATGNAIFVVGVVVAFALAVKVVSWLVGWYGRNLPRVIEPERNFLPFVRHLVDTLLFLVAVAVVLHHFNVEAGRVVQSLLIFALAVSLSLKSTVENFWSGTLIHFARPFRPHDWIRLPLLRIAEVPIEGEVIEIGKLATKLRLEDGASMRIVNSTLMNDPLINLTKRYDVTDRVRTNQGRRHMGILELIIILCVVGWALGFFAFHAAGGFIHLLLVIAAVVVVIRIVQGRRVV